MAGLALAQIYSFAGDYLERNRPPWARLVGERYTSERGALRPLHRLSDPEFGLGAAVAAAPVRWPVVPQTAAASDRCWSRQSWAQAVWKGAGAASTALVLDRARRNPGICSV